MKSLDGWACISGFTRDLYLFAFFFTHKLLSTLDLYLLRLDLRHLRSCGHPGTWDMVLGAHLVLLSFMGQAAHHSAQR